MCRATDELREQQELYEQALKGWISQLKQETKKVRADTKASVSDHDVHELPER